MALIWRDGQGLPRLAINLGRSMQEKLGAFGHILDDDAKHRKFDKMADNNNTSNAGSSANPSNNNANAASAAESKPGDSRDGRQDRQRGGRDQKRGRGNGRDSGRGRGRGGNNHGSRQNQTRGEKGRGEWRLVFETPSVDY